MKNYIKFTLLLMTQFLFALNAVADNFNLPENLEISFRKACLTDDAFIKDAVRSKAIENYPKLSRAINDYWGVGCMEDRERVANAQHEEDEKKEKNWKVSVEAGLSSTTGNTKERDINLSTKLTHDTENWKNTLLLEGINKEKDKARISEEYRISGNSRLKWKGDHYLFADAKYVNDRFSGYTYRLSETVGYGYGFINNDKTTLEAEYSMGGRQSELTNGTKEATLLNKLSGRFKHDITKRISFLEEVTISFGEDATISESDSALKTTLTDGLYMKLGFNVEHISDVPEGNKNTDTLTTLNLGYDF